MSEPYAKVTPADFDKYDCLKLSKSIYLILLFVLRGYLVWIMSVTNMQDRVGIIQWVYPDTTLFYLSLFSGLFGIFVILLLSLRRPNASNWVKTAWRKLRVILLIALVFDLIINTLAYYLFQLQTLQWLLINAMFVAISTIFLFRSKLLALNIKEFPEVLPEK